MPREHPDYRNHLERLDSIFPGRTRVKVTEVAKAEGCSKRTVYNRYGDWIRDGSIPVTTLARLMCHK